MTELEYLDPMSIDGLSPERVRKIPVENFRSKEFFMTSLTYLIHGVVMIFEEGLWKVFVLQYFLLFALLSVGNVFNVTIFVAVFCIGMFTGVQTLSYVWLGIFLLVTLGIVVLSMAYSYQLKDCQRRLSEKTEKIMKNGSPDPLFECWHCSETCSTFFLVMFFTGLVEGAIILIYVIAFVLIIMWIPLINTIVPFLFQVLFSGYFTFKIVFVRKGDFFGMFKYIYENYMVFLGFGVWLALFAHIPIIGHMDIFLGAVAFTRFYLHYEYFKHKDSDPTDTSALIMPPNFEEEDYGEEEDYEEEDEEDGVGVGYQEEDDDDDDDDIKSGAPPIEEEPLGYGDDNQ